MNALRSVFLSVLLLVCATALGAQSAYYPTANEWERRAPAELGLDDARIQEAVAWAQQHESDAPRDLEVAHYQSFGREPFGDGVGPFKERGPQTGLIVYRGYIVAEWGEPERVDMTFSVTKSFLSTTVGLAYDRGLIPNLDEPVHERMAPVFVPAWVDGRSARGAAGMGDAHPLDLWSTPHNRTVTWDHLLRQTSDWEGTLWTKPDWADRPDRDPSTWTTRERHAAGTTYEYNDVRVNLLALAATNVWRRPLPEVLREHVMDPIGASQTWRWHGYDNSWIVLDGALVQAVSGGGHWGGGMFINAFDQARFGLLTLRDGRWGDQQILSERWLALARTPTPAETGYGFMNFFLNGRRERYPSAPETAFAHLGSGTNLVYVDPEHDLVIVARWIQGSAIDGLIQRVVGSF